MRCELLTLVRPEKQSGVMLTGTGGVRVEGVPRHTIIRADRFSFSSDTGGFTFGGDVRLEQPGSTWKLRACSVTRTGEVREQQSLLDDFRTAPDATAKLALLPQLARVYEDNELPAEARYLLALYLLRPHLIWHAPYLTPAERERDREDVAREKHRAGDAWQEAMGGEEWMHGDIPEATRQEVRQALARWQEAHAGKGERLLKIPPVSAYFWRLREPSHQELPRVRRLLEGVRGDLESHARRWLAEIERNNTVLTCDIPGGGAAGKPFPVVMDVRNADRVAFMLYRIERPEDLLWVTNRIGDDFIYRDHGLQYPGWERERIKVLEERDAMAVGKRGAAAGEQMPLTAFRPEKLVHRWDVRVADLKALPASPRVATRGLDRHDWGDREDADAWYFDDYCDRFRERLEGRYRPRPGQFSSWQCGRIVEVPGKALAQPGAYVLLAESNGQKAYVPVVIDPLSLTLRRCRDGLFALVSDGDGLKPVAGARILGKRMLGEAVTDAEGATFARIFAAGNRAIVAHHEGRFAVGGFGRVFDGIYVSPLDMALDRLYGLMKRGERGDAKHTEELRVYADRHVLAAYTDRPTYRPGQEVQFKLIVRRLAPEAVLVADGKPRPFRADDFDIPVKLALPDTTKPLPYVVLDPNGRGVAAGTLTLSEFGTAAAQVALNDEAALGPYSLRVWVAGSNRVVPAVFAVKHYRRPSFEVDVAGVPAKLTQVRDLTLDVCGRYYFGKPVAGGTLHAQLLTADRWRSVTEAECRLDEKGTARLKLKLPAHLSAGHYRVICSVTDDSDRTVTKALPLEIVSAASTAGPELAAVPRFLPAGGELLVKTAAKEIVVEQDKTVMRFGAIRGAATLKFPVPGWYRLRVGAQQAEVFAYGGDKHPLDLRSSQDPDKHEHPWARHVGWVNLSDYHWQESGRPSRCENAAQQLLALFDRHQVAVGDKLRLLVYVPHERARLLFTAEGRTVLDYLVTWTPKEKGRYHVVEIPIKARHFPAFYLQGRILAGEGPTGQSHPEVLEAREQLLRRYDEDDGVNPLWCRVDVLDPKRKPGEAPLHVQVETERGEFRPGDRVNVRLKVTDRQGMPRRAEVSFAAVDESVYTFGEDNLAGLAGFFGTPHETPRFLPKAWRSSVGNKWRAGAGKGGAGQLQDMAKMAQAAQREMRQAIDKAVKQLEASQADRIDAPRALPPAMLGGELPVGGIPLGRLRQDFRETASWQPLLRTGADGSAETSFKLPDSLTCYRLTAVALTKDSEVGVGRARLRVTLPLAVQLMLPRFAVEKDRLFAVALIHNGTDRERICQIHFAGQGAKFDRASAALRDWKATEEDGKVSGRGVVTVPAQGTARVGVWLKLDQIGPVTLTCRAAADELSDGETRTLTVQPRGRPQEVIANGALPQVPGKPQEKRIDLPAGFVARDLRISLASSEEAQALDGLEYLIGYPYGCIEQTMSRFLPAVMVAHAARQASLELPSQVEAKLPDVLAKGLARVYGFQHADGSWGWFDKDDRNDPMTVYVVYGLARCRTTGTPVDREVLDRGCSYLRAQLRGRKLSSDLAARAWYALTLAERADVKELEADVRQRWAELSPEGRCNFALACRTAGLHELGERLWAAVRTWQPSGAEQSALFLNTQIAYGASWDDCRRSSRQLLSLRSGDRWEHTRATSWAIEALGQMLAYLPERSAVRRLQVRVGGRTVLDLTEPADLSKRVYRVHLPAQHLPTREGLDIRLIAESPEQVHFALRAEGVQRLDEIRPSGSRLKILRHLETLDGKPLTEAVAAGQVFRVRLELELAQAENYLIIEDRRPAGCEFADERLEGEAARGAAHVDWRDDRVCIFRTSLSAGRHELVYYLRAETPGVSQVLPGCVYPMYADTNRGETGSARVQVNERGP